MAIVDSAWIGGIIHRLIRKKDGELQLVPMKELKCEDYSCLDQ